MFSGVIMVDLLVSAGRQMESILLLVARTI